MKHLRPEKKEIDLKSLNVELGCYQNGFNNCIDEYEKFLPSEEEIRKMIIDMDVEKRKKHPQEDATFIEIAKAISERIGGG